jgi:ATP synthase F1, epsilon subunit
MNNTFNLEIVTPEGKIFSDGAKFAQFPGSEGDLGVLPGHASLVTLLKAGIIEITDKNDKKDIVAINWGYLKIDEQKVSVLAEGAVYIGGNSDSVIAASLQRAKDLIKAMANDSSVYASTVAKLDSFAGIK